MSVQTIQERIPRTLHPCAGCGENWCAGTEFCSFCDAIHRDLEFGWSQLPHVNVGIQEQTSMHPKTLAVAAVLAGLMIGILFVFVGGLQ